MIRVGINGYGRIGRAFHRQSLSNPHLQVVAVNSRAGAASHAYLLKHDSMYGQLHQEVEVVEDKGGEGRGGGFLGLSLLETLSLLGNGGILAVVLWKRMRRSA